MSCMPLLQEEAPALGEVLLRMSCPAQDTEAPHSHTILQTDQGLYEVVTDPRH